ncbi:MULTISPECIES: GntR family transcriptional regulator [unclassified Pseudoclavibacter]|uniref:GntR family transcriptional regulator n=1 Tax=unclassified Pseudoclavibacter TaxID=2615177 RepID=UPI001301587B|nr:MULTISPECIES: GntR family transcriptional regulator [unclassified Pseudoclavibacter]KAB1644607.1 GntR family transcriptional regulator [Pseudoclavibacter sp. CFCC 14310]KAB1663880.1 GntR family transcriptional regulator [Pseudoclavibacter sp. CFCC 13611]
MSRYSGVAADLRRRILDGEFLVGSRLPSEQTLGDDYRVSRKTVRNALAALERRGLIMVRRGSGWFVAQTQQTQGFDQMRSFAQWARDRGLAPGGRIVSREQTKANVREARMLRTHIDDSVLRMTRVRTLQERTVMIERSTWAPWVLPLIRDVPDDVVSTTATLRDHGLHVVYGQHRIEAVAASSADSRLLGVRRSSPLLQVRRVTFSRDGRVVEVGEDRYLPDTIVFEIAAAGAATA